MIQLHSRAASSRVASRPCTSAKVTTAAPPARLRLMPRRAVEEVLDDNPFFNDAFKNVLMEALDRQAERNNAPEPSGHGNGSSYGSSYSDSSSSSYSSSSNGYSSNGSSNGYSSPTHIPDSFASSSYSSYSSFEEETGPSLQEEVLITALGSSKTTLNQLRQVQKALERAIEREEKQVERLEFALQKAHTDAAYYASLEKLNRSKRRSWRDL